MHGGRGGYGYSNYGYTPRPFSPPPPRISNGGGGGGSSRRVRAPWSPGNSSVVYTPAQVQALAPVRRTIEKRARLVPALWYDVFLCHAWDDRRGAATDLHDLLEERNVTVWFSEREIALGQPFLREIDKGLAKTRTGLVLVTPALLKRVESGGVSDKELSALLRRDQLIPVLHGTTYEDLERVSPLLASRNGLDTGEDSMEVVATKIAEMVTVPGDAREAGAA